MNELINNIFNLWGIEANTPLIMTIVIFTSLLFMATFLLIISKIAKPSASNNRAFVFKSFVIFCMIACLLTLNVTIGGNIIFKEKEGGTPTTPTTPTLKDGYIITSIESGRVEPAQYLEDSMIYTIEADGIIFAGLGYYSGPDADLLNGNEANFRDGVVLSVKRGDVFEAYSGGLYYYAFPSVPISDAIE